MGKKDRYKEEDLTIQETAVCYNATDQINSVLFA